MDEDTQAHLDAGQRVQIFNTKNSVLLLTIPGHAGWKTKLDNVINEMLLAGKKQEEDNTGIVGDKDSLGTILIKSVMKYSLRAKIFAKDLTIDGQKLLLDGLSHSATYYRGSADITVNRTTAVKELMKKNLSILTVLEAGDITEMETNITAFTGIKDKPVATAKEKKTEGTDLMAPLVVRLDDALESIGDLVHSYFPDTLMSANFDLTSKLIKHGRHNVLEVHFVDEDGNPIPGGVLSDLNSDKTAKADEDHVATITGVKTGKGNFKAEATGKVAQTINVKVKRSTTTIVIVKMTNV